MSVDADSARCAVSFHRSSMLSEGLQVLACPGCGSRYSSTAHHDPESLVCGRCGRVVPVVDGVPCFVGTQADPAARRTQESFGYEWTHFSDWRNSGSTNSNDYFQGVDLAALSGRTVLDAGCGMGRHARHVATFARLVIAADFSRAIGQAARNTAEFTNVTCIQADVLALPLVDHAFDFVYSLGVLHHLADTERALGGLVSKLKPGGRLRVYLYWKRHGIQGRLLSVVSLIRRVTIRLPFPVLRGLCWLLSAVLALVVVQPYRLLSRLGVRRHESWPLFVTRSTRSRSSTTTSSIGSRRRSKNAMIRTKSIGCCGTPGSPMSWSDPASAGSRTVSSPPERRFPSRRP